MIKISLQPKNHIKAFYFLRYFDPIRMTEVAQPVSKENIPLLRATLQKKLGTDDIQLISVYTEVEIEED